MKDPLSCTYQRFTAEGAGKQHKGSKSGTFCLKMDTLHFHSNGSGTAKLGNTGLHTRRVLEGGAEETGPVIKSIPVYHLDPPLPHVNNLHIWSSPVRGSSPGSPETLLSLLDVISFLEPLEPFKTWTDLFFHFFLLY